MKSLLHAAVALAIVATMSGMLLAQWAPFPTRAVPKNAAGQPDLTAPAPRTADGKPDLSGIWTNARGGRGQRGGAGNAPAAPAQAPAPAAGAIPIASFGNAAAGLKDGQPPLQPWAAELVKKRMADFSKDNPDAHCLPMGFMQFHTHPQPRKIIQTPDVIMIVYEPNSGLRSIFMDGRPLPGPEAEPWWYGYSVGKWEGDTLVVETRGMRDGGWLDVRGNPTTEAARIIEKFRRVNYGSLEIEVTIDDPKAYTSPWTVKVNQSIMLNTELIEFICEDRDATHYVGADGKK